MGMVDRVRRWKPWNWARPETVRRGDRGSAQSMTDDPRGATAGWGEVGRDAMGRSVADLLKPGWPRVDVGGDRDGAPDHRGDSRRRPQRHRRVHRGGPTDDPRSAKCPPRRHAGGYRRTETFYGTFERVVPLAVEVDADHATASSRRGELTVRLPEKRGGPPGGQRIPVHDAAEEQA